ncbi:ABC transporter permease [Rhodoblastus acidophilus]|nr:ABC transporter permease [Rhodoblastus acidophilus]
MEGAFERDAAPDGGSDIAGQGSPAGRAPADSLATLRLTRDAFVAAGDWFDAAPLAVRIAQILPNDAAEQRHASGILSQSGRVSEAIHFALRAVDLDPSNYEYALHAGCIYNLCGDRKAAIPLLLQAVKINPQAAEAFQQLSAAADNLGRPDYAAKLALRAWRLDPKNEHRGFAAAHLFARAEQWDAAIAVLRKMEEAIPPSAALHRTLSGFLGHTRRFEEAVKAGDAAVALDGDNPEYRIHHSHMLMQLGRIDEANAAIARAIELDPSNLVARRHAVSLLVEKGDLGQALRCGAELLALAPDDPEYADCMRFLLEARSMSAAAEDFGQIAALKRAAPPRKLAEPVTFAGAAQAQASTIFALVLRDIRSRYGESKLGFFWALMEPFIHIAVLAFVFQFTMHGKPPMGNSFFLFYFTGVMPYLLVSHLISHLGVTIRSYKQLMQIPRITPLDLLVARAIVELFTTAVIYLLFLALFGVFGINALPISPQNVLGAFAITWVLGFGLGCCLASLAEFGVAAEHVVNVVLRLLYFGSGIFYVPSMMPVRARNILSWNPFMHVVDYMRIGYFRSYHPSWMDISYAVAFSIFAMAAGLASVMAMRRRMRTIA